MRIRINYQHLTFFLKVLRLLVQFFFLESKACTATRIAALPVMHGQFGHQMARNKGFIHLKKKNLVDLLQWQRRLLPSNQLAVISCNEGQADSANEGKVSYREHSKS